MKHPHAELMKQYAEDAMETDTPWERWEYSYEGEIWGEMYWNLQFTDGVAYRRKPEPEEVLPPVGTPVWVRDNPDDAWIIRMFKAENKTSVYNYPVFLVFETSLGNNLSSYRYMTTENPYKPAV